MEHDAYSDSEGRASSDVYADTPSPEESLLDLRSSPVKRRRSIEDESPQQSKKTRHGQEELQERSGPKGLPPRVWQRIFSFTAPKTLGKLLAVNHTFKRYLTYRHSQICSTQEQEDVLSASLKTPEKSWSGKALAVQSFFRGYWNYEQLRVQPAQEQDNIIDSEHVWASSRRLHYPWLPEPLIGQLEPDMWRLIGGKTCDSCGLSINTSQTEEGHTEELPDIVWPFGVRLCSSCICNCTHDEPSLLFSPLSGILGAAPFAFRCGDSVIPTISLSELPPSTTEVKKIFYKPILEAIKARTGSLERYQHLEKLRKDLMESVRHWEQCAQTGKLYLSPNPDLDDVKDEQARVLAKLEDDASPIAKPSQAPSLGIAKDPNEANTARQDEIERRCMELDPPLPPHFLQHMDLFQAAVQSSHDLTEKEWDLLRPHLTEQRQLAEHFEKKRLIESEARRRVVEKPRQRDPSSKEQKDISEREWEDSQRSVREKLGAYADEVIVQSWAEGRAVNYKNAPKFAADVFTHVRRRFYSDLAKDAHDEPSHEDMQVDTESGSPRFLVLDHMRWMWHAKVKPLTEQHRKNPFFCNACNDRRPFAFESVIQHYATKHTHTFSAGQVTVQWKTAEWPEIPPFALDPSSRAAGHGRNSSGPYANSIMDAAKASAPRTPFIPVAVPPGGYPLAASSPRPLVNSGYVAPYGLPAHSPFQAQVISYPVPSSPFAPVPRVPIRQSPIPPFHGWPQPPPTFSPPQFTTSFDVPASQDGSSLYQEQLNLVAHTSLSIWSLISGHRKIPLSVKIHVVISHVISRFQELFSNEPSLDLFSNFLDNLSLTSSSQHASPLKNNIGLACKTCVLKNEDLDEAHSSAFRLSRGDRKLYSFYSLIQHFKNVHIDRPSTLGEDEPDSGSPERLDWKTDMIELPDPDFVKGLENLQDMDETKMKLLRQAFPDVFQISDHDRSAARTQNDRPGDAVARPSSVRVGGSFANMAPSTNSAPQQKGDSGQDYAARSKDNWTEQGLPPYVDIRNVDVADVDRRSSLVGSSHAHARYDSGSGLASRQTSRGSVYRNLGHMSISDPYRQPGSRTDSPLSVERQATRTGHSPNSDVPRLGSVVSARLNRSPSIRSERRMQDASDRTLGTPPIDDKAAADRFFNEYEREFRSREEFDGQSLRRSESTPYENYSVEDQRRNLYEQKNPQPRQALYYYNEDRRVYAVEQSPGDRGFEDAWQPTRLASQPAHQNHTHIVEGRRTYYYEPLESGDGRSRAPMERYIYQEVPVAEGVEYIPLHQFQETGRPSNASPNEPQGWRRHQP